jgi:hypothetical protein
MQGDEMTAQQLHHQPVLPFLVTNCVSNKTLGAVYAVSIQSAKDIANVLWVNDNDALHLFDIRREYEGVHSDKIAMACL